jgi:hypothetical protein
MQQIGEFRGKSIVLANSAGANELLQCVTPGTAPSARVDALHLPRKLRHVQGSRSGNIVLVGR